VKKNLRRAFTLVEIMIVVLIIGILLAIAVPNFVRAREASRAKACTANLKQIDSAKEQWAMDNRVSAGSAGPALSVLVGSTSYIKSTPECPSSGSYTVDNIGTNPACSVGGTGALGHVLP
jgi:prepilin-type N-terminal cleavage/methylation domain-containing protein